MLTKRQRGLLDYLKRYHAEHSEMPSYRQACDAIGLGSTSGINRLVVSLEERGYIRRIPNKARAIELTAKARGQEKTREELQAEIDALRVELIAMDLRLERANKALANARLETFKAREMAA